MTGVIYTNGVPQQQHGDVTYKGAIMVVCSVAGIRQKDLLHSGLFRRSRPASRSQVTNMYNRRRMVRVCNVDIA